jgi:cell division protein FtsW (lipid II flippase)
MRVRRPLLAHFKTRGLFWRCQVKTTAASFFKKTLCILVIFLLILIPVVAVYGSRLTPAEVNEWKMWINLAISGYAEPMQMNPPGEKPWWKFW